MTTPTQSDLDLIRHALGLKYATKPCRRYVVVTDHPRHEQCKRMMEFGWMEFGYEAGSEMTVYHVMPAGAALVGEELP